MAALRGHTSIVELLLAAGASTACSVGMGFTALLSLLLLLLLLGLSPQLHTPLRDMMMH
jgi:ankyrin repeat protein